MNQQKFSLPRILALLALLAWVIILSPYPTTVFMAGAIACMTLPLYRWLRVRYSRIASVAAYTAGMFAVIILPVAVVSVLIVPQAISGVRSLNQWRASGWAISPELQEMVASMETAVSKIPLINDWFLELSQNIDTLTNEALRYLVSGGLGVAGGTVHILWQLFLFVVLAALAVVYAPTMAKVAVRVTRLPEDSFKRFVFSMRSAVRAVFIGIVFVAIVQGTLCGIGYRIFGVKDPAFWGLLSVFVAIIPVVGTAIVWVPMVVVLWFTVSPWSAIGMAAWGLFVVGGSDNIIRPYMLKTSIEAPLFVLLLAILCSMTVLGAVGLVAGPVLVAFAIQAMKESDILLKREKV